MTLQTSLQHILLAGTGPVLNKLLLITFFKIRQGEESVI